MNETPRSERVHIGLFGRRNVGKSSLINLLTDQETALVSPVAGTTTDPVYKAMEVLPLGPVVFVDTAGLDDEGTLGEKRVARTNQALRKMDLSLIVVSGEDEPGEFEEKLVSNIIDKGIPIIGIINKIDLGENIDSILDWFALKGISAIPVSAATGQGRPELLGALIKSQVADKEEPSIVGGMIEPGETAILVVPIDTGAPKGRIILPQVQTIRDILDHQGQSVVVTVEQLAAAIDNLRTPPKLVITDSQAFGQVSELTPEYIMLTSFSIVFARYKGRLTQLVEGALAIADLKPGDRVLIAEACTHHSQKDDIGRLKIPRWLNRIVGGPLEYTYSIGWDFPRETEDIKMVIHCGACMLNRREMIYRLNFLRQKGMPVVNYGVLIAYVHGILERVLRPFPEALALWTQQEDSNDLF